MIYLILLFAFLIRLISLDQSLWLDEATTGLVAQMPVSEILSKFSFNDFHPPLYYLVIRLWSQVFGISEISLRLPSILFSLGTIYIVYKLVSLYTTHHSLYTARLSALLLATSSLFIYYSQEARMYMFSTFLVTLAVFSHVKTIKSSDRVGYWILFTLTLLLLSFSDYLPNFIILIFWIMAYKIRKNRNWIKKFVASHIILAAGWLWWFPNFLKQISNGLNVSSDSPAWWNILGKFSFKEIALIPTKFIIGRVSIDNKWLYGLIVIWLIVIFGYLLLRSLRYFKDTKIIYLWLIFPVVCTILISVKIPVLTYFRLLFVLPAFYILIALGISTLNKPFRYIMFFLILAVNILTSGFYLLNSRFHRENWREIVNLQGQVVMPSNNQMEGYLYYSKAVPALTIDTVDSKSDIIWLVRYVWEINDPHDLTRLKIIEMGYKKTEERSYNGVLVYKYEKVK